MACGGSTEPGSSSTDTTAKGETTEGTVPEAGTSKGGAGKDGGAKGAPQPGQGPGFPDGGDIAPAAATAACEGKAENEACSFELEGNAIEGTCLKSPMGAVACRPADGQGPPAKPSK
jgi:hypothetical protein